MLEGNWRKEKLLVIRKKIFAYAPEMKEEIRYSMFNYGKDDYFGFALMRKKIRQPLCRYNRQD